MYARIYSEGGLQFVLLAQLCRLDVSFGVEYGIFSGMVWGEEFLTPVSVHRIEGG